MWWNIRPIHLFSPFLSKSTHGVGKMRFSKDFHPHLHIPLLYQRIGIRSRAYFSFHFHENRFFYQIDCLVLYVNQRLGVWKKKKTKKHVPMIDGLLLLWFFFIGHFVWAVIEFIFFTRVKRKFLYGISWWKKWLLFALNNSNSSIKKITEQNKTECDSKGRKKCSIAIWLLQLNGFNQQSKCNIYPIPLFEKVQTANTHKWSAKALSLPLNGEWWLVICMFVKCP